MNIQLAYNRLGSIEISSKEHEGPSSLLLKAPHVYMIPKLSLFPLYYYYYMLHCCTIVHVMFCWWVDGILLMLVYSIS